MMWHKKALLTILSHAFATLVPLKVFWRFPTIALSIFVYHARKTKNIIFFATHQMN